MLVTAEWLSIARQSDDVVILDCTVIVYDQDDGRKDSRPGLAEYHVEHIAGARFADLLSDFSIKRRNARFGIPSATEFAKAAAKLGVSNDTKLVVYSTSSPLWATRLWWLFKYFGHENVAVLDGSLHEWKAAGLPLETGDMPQIQHGDFRARVHTDRLALKSDVLSTVTSPDQTSKVIDVLSPDYYAGKAGNIYGYTRLGHIKRAINLPAETVLTDDGKSFRSTAEIQALTEAQIGPLQTPVITYCGGGIAATQLAFALEMAGFSDVKVYSGSLQEWSADHDLPMETEAS